MSSVSRCSSPGPNAWDFVSFALGGDAPPFADTVRLLVHGISQTTFTGLEAHDDSHLGEAFDLITTAGFAPSSAHADRDAVSSVEHVESARPVVRRATSQAETTPSFALRLPMDARQAQNDVHCPLTIDLYRSERVINTVVIYPARADTP